MPNCGAFRSQPVSQRDLVRSSARREDLSRGGYSDFTSRRLAPATLNEDISPMPAPPAMVNPASADPRSRSPNPWTPGVGITVPPMIPALPNITRAGRYAPSFDDRNRRRNPNHNLPGRCTEGERTRKNQTKQSFTQHIAAPYPQWGKSVLETRLEYGT